MPSSPINSYVLKPCSLCERPIIEQRIDTPAGDVRLLSCPFCDRRRCKTCDAPDSTGTALHCAACGDSMLHH